MKSCTNNCTCILAKSILRILMMCVCSLFAFSCHDENDNISTPQKEIIIPRITVFSAGPIALSTGSQTTVPFSVSPSDSFLDLNSCQLILSSVDSSLNDSNDICPTNFSLVRVEQAYDNGTEEIMMGEYLATIEDALTSAEYTESAVLRINTKNANGNAVQISSNAFEIVGRVNNELPIIVINTPDNEPIISKNDYITGATVVIRGTDNIPDFQGEMKIKGRGNSTWEAPKKPYKMKFDKKQSLMGEPKDKEWVLLANYFDKSMIRSEISYWMATQYGQFDYVPNFHFVDMILNGKYNGTYQLGDQLKIAENRVNVGEDGFLLEIDGKADPTDITFKVPHIPQPINIKDPDVEINDENYNFVKDFISRADAALYSTDWLDKDNGYKSLIDIDSFVEWYLIMEITKNGDACFYTSCYMNLARNGKLKMGPLWDFDTGLGGYPPLWGNEFLNQPEDFHIKNASWINRMFADPEFVALVKERFNSYYDNKSAIIDHIGNVAETNKQSAIANNRVWGVLCNESDSDTATESAYNEQVDYVKTWLSTRLDWLKIAIDAL